MTQDTSSPPDAVLELPPSAPRVRITAGIGSAAQKTWNLRRPVTVIGSRRPAHIVLHDPDISHAHCVIVNTGDAVVVKDLHTRGGTLCNTARIELTEIDDGDVLTVGTTKIQIAIVVPEALDAGSDEDRGVADATLMPCPFSVALVHTEQRWTVRESVVLVGRLPAAFIPLEHQEVSQRHAVFFRFAGSVGVFDLNGGRGLAVNGRLCPGSMLSNGDRVTIGSFALQVTLPRGLRIPTVDSSVVASPAEPRPMSVVSALPGLLPAPSETVPSPATAPPIDLNGGRDPVAEITTLNSKLNDLRGQISESWGRLNSYTAAPDAADEAGPLGKANTDAAARETRLEERDALVRGQLHDIEHYHKELAERERELESQLARLELQQKALLEAEAGCATREAEVVRRHEELARREHVVAQRWSRLMTSKCPHCGERLAVAEEPDGYSS